MAKRKPHMSNDIRIRVTKEVRKILDAKPGGAHTFAKAVILHSCRKERLKSGELGNRTHPNESAPPAVHNAAAPPGRGRLSDLCTPKDGMTLAEFTLNYINESDRGMVLVCHGLLDGELEHLFRLRFVLSGMQDGDIDRVLTANHPPLQSFFWKVKIAHGFGLLAADFCDAAIAFNALRIVAAHSPREFRLTDAEVNKNRNNFRQDHAMVLDMRTDSTLKSFLRVKDELPKFTYTRHRKCRLLFENIVLLISSEIGGKIKELAKAIQSERAQ